MRALLLFSEVPLLFFAAVAGALFIEAPTARVAVILLLVLGAPPCFVVILGKRKARAAWVYLSIWALVAFGTLLLRGLS